MSWLAGDYEGPRLRLAVPHELSPAELRTRWALNEALRRDAPGWPYRAHGHVVFPGVPRRGFGRGTAAQSRVTHATRSLALAWRGGRLVGVMAVWACARRSPMFELLERPEGVVCGHCALATGLAVIVRRTP